MITLASRQYEYTGQYTIWLYWPVDKVSTLSSSTLASRQYDYTGQ